MVMLSWWQVALVVLLSGLLSGLLGAALLALVVVLRSPRGWTGPRWRR